MSEYQTDIKYKDQDRHNSQQYHRKNGIFSGSFSNQNERQAFPSQDNIQGIKEQPEQTDMSEQLKISPTIIIKTNKIMEESTLLFSNNSQINDSEELKRSLSKHSAIFGNEEGCKIEDSNKKSIKQDKQEVIMIKDDDEIFEAESKIILQVDKTQEEPKSLSVQNQDNIESSESQNELDEFNQNSLKIQTYESSQLFLISPNHTTKEEISLQNDNKSYENIFQQDPLFSAGRCHKKNSLEQIMSSNKFKKFSQSNKLTQEQLLILKNMFSDQKKFSIHSQKFHDLSQESPKQRFNTFNIANKNKTIDKSEEKVNELNSTIKKKNKSFSSYKKKLKNDQNDYDDAPSQLSGTMLSEDYLLQSKWLRRKDSRYINQQQPQVKLKITKNEIHDYVFEKQFKERKKNLIIFSIALMMSGGTHCLFYNNDFQIFDKQFDADKQENQQFDFIVNNMILAVYPVAQILNQYLIEVYGMHFALITSQTSNTIAAVLLIILSNEFPYYFWILLASRTLSAFGLSIQLSMIAKMSQVWFPKNEKTWALAFSFCMLFLGCLLSFLNESGEQLCLQYTLIALSNLMIFILIVWKFDKIYLNKQGRYSTSQDDLSDEEHEDQKQIQQKEQSPDFKKTTEGLLDNIQTSRKNENESVKNVSFQNEMEQSKKVDKFQHQDLLTIRKQKQKQKQINLQLNVLKQMHILIFKNRNYLLFSLSSACILQSFFFLPGSLARIHVCKSQQNDHFMLSGITYFICGIIGTFSIIYSINQNQKQMKIMTILLPIPSIIIMLSICIISYVYKDPLSLLKSRNIRYSFELSGLFSLSYFSVCTLNVILITKSQNIGHSISCGLINALACLIALVVYQVFYKSVIFHIQNANDELNQNYQNVCIFYIVEISLVSLGAFLNIFVDKIQEKKRPKRLKSFCNGKCQEIEVLLQSDINLQQNDDNE